MSTPGLALLNARLIDPATGMDGRGGVWIENGRITAVGAAVTTANLPADATLVDCRGDVVAPGLVDMQARLGADDTSPESAAAGGVTSLLAVPDKTTDDDLAALSAQIGRGRGLVRILPCGPLTDGRRGDALAEIGLMHRAGALAFSDGSRSLANAGLLRRAMLYARDFDTLIIHFAEDRDLAGDGVMNEGELASRLGLSGIPREAETIILERDMQLVALTGARYHAALISTEASLAIIARAKKRGLPVTCGVSINNLTLNEIDIGAYRTEMKMKPPLRGEDDRLALVEGVASGLIDVIVSDHDPQDAARKDLSFATASVGAIGLETLLPAALRLVASEQITLPALLRALSSRPAAILRVPQGRLASGAPADLIQFDPEEPFVVDAETLRSRCKNTPLAGARLEGRVQSTIVSGIMVFERKL